MQKETKATVKIPRPLYRRVQQVITNSGFSSPTEFIVYVLRDLMSEVESKDEQEFSPEELAAIRQKLKNLGYL
jgi:metal-responsive CopG/Arc/MetJ family transcriptional regulator